MSLLGGTAAITVSGGSPMTAVYSGSGLALALAQARFGPCLVTFNAIGPGIFPPGSLLEIVQASADGIVEMANSDGPAIVAYLVANASVSLSGCHAEITTQSCASSGGTALDPPLANVSLPVSGSGSLT